VIRRPVPDPEGGPAARPGSRLAPLGVRDLNEAADAILGDSIGVVWVRGELVRFLAHRSGHWYFSLVDGGASVSCAMFRGNNRKVAFEPRDGLEVVVLARPGVYAPQGRFQLIVEALEPLGSGAAALALEQLRRRLAAEGLFDPARKRPLPLLPRMIGVVTSADGAALRDVLRVLRRRFPGARVVVSPTLVQGEAAPAGIAEALARIDRLGPEVILLVRGGGAREDLAAFDDERVVRAVAACHAPVVTGIGHEIDTTLADLAADVRAPTPSAAAEVVVREAAELLEKVRSLRGRLVRAVTHRLGVLRGSVRQALSARGLRALPLRIQRLLQHVAELDRRAEARVRHELARRRRRLGELAGRLSPTALAARIAARRARLAAVRDALRAAAREELAARRSRLARLAARLEEMSPLAVLGRGYALVTRDSPDGPVVLDAATVDPGDRLHVRLARGALVARVEERIRGDDPPAGGEEER